MTEHLLSPIQEIFRVTLDALEASAALVEVQGCLGTQEGGVVTGTLEEELLLEVHEVVVAGDQGLDPVPVLGVHPQKRRPSWGKAPFVEVTGVEVGTEFL